MKLAEKYVFNSSTISTIDKDAIAQNDPGYGFILMERAAKFSFEALMNNNPSSLTVFCGSGNNAGDGYLLAKMAIESGLITKVITIESEGILKGDAKNARDAFKKAGGLIEKWSPNITLSSDWVVDAIFGIGLNRDIESPYKEAIEFINGSKSKVLAIDIPSGLCGTTGKIFGRAISANITTTYVGKKSGLYLDNGANCTGTVYFSDLDIDQAFYTEHKPLIKIVSEKEVSNVLLDRKQTSHKGDNGHILLIGGNDGMEGAIRIASEAALRAGSGLVSVISKPTSCEIINQFRPEVMCHDVTNKDKISSLIARADIIGIGPGLGTDDWAIDLFNLAVKSDKYLVLDADALNILSSNPKKRGNWTLTPHPGEAARLLDNSVNDIQKDRLASISKLSESYSANILLKGKYSLIQDLNNDIPFMITSGNPGMATAGMGDLLTGVTCSLLGQFGTEDSAKIASVAGHVHSKSGDLASHQGERGMIASDLLTYIRELVNP